MFGSRGVVRATRVTLGQAGSSSSGGRGGKTTTLQELVGHEPHWSLAEFAAKGREGETKEALDETQLAYLCRMVRLEFAPARDGGLAYDVNQVLRYIDDIHAEEIGTEEAVHSVAPMYSPVQDVESLQLRQDTEECGGGALGEEDTLQHARVKHAPYFVAPKVVDKS